MVIPKSTKQARIADNANVFDFTLDKADVDVSLDLAVLGERCWVPGAITDARFGAGHLQHLTALDEFLITDWEVTTVP